MRFSHFLPGGLVLAVLASAGATHPNANPTVGTVAVGIAPSTVTIDEQTRRVFVVNQGPPYTVSVLDSQTGKVLRTVAGSSHQLDKPAGPMVLDTRHDRGFILNVQSASVSVFNAATGRRLHVVPLEFQPQYMAIDAVRGRAFIPDDDEDDADAGVEILDTVHLHNTGTAPVHGSAILDDERTGHVFISTARGVSMFDAATGRILGTTPVAGSPVALDAAAHRIFILKGSPRYTVDFRLNVLDTRTGAVVGSLPLPLERTYSLVVDSHRHRAFLAVGQAVYVLDTVKGRRLRTIAVHQGLSRFAASPLAVDTKTGYVYAVSSTLDSNGAPTGSGYVRVLDPGTGAIVRTIKIAAYPAAIAIDNRTRRVFVLHSPGSTIAQTPSDSRGSVTILDASRP